jgi:hypothetical protein
MNPAEDPAVGDGQPARGEHGPQAIRVGAVQQAVAQRDPLRCRERLLLRRSHGGEVRVVAVASGFPERVSLGEDASAVVAIAVAEHEGLGDEPAGPELLRSGQQVGGALGAQPVGPHHPAVPQRRLLQRRELVDDRVGDQPLHRPQQAVAVERVGHDRPRAERSEPGGARGSAGQSEDLVTAREKSAGERDTERAGGAGEQNVHGVPRYWRRARGGPELGTGPRVQALLSGWRKARVGSPARRHPKVGMRVHSWRARRRRTWTEVVADDLASIAPRSALAGRDDQGSARWLSHPGAPSHSRAGTGCSPPNCTAPAGRSASCLDGV